MSISLLRLFPLALPCLVLLFSMTASQAKEVTLEARLVWGTNEEKSPNPEHKLMDGDVARKLKTLPFKWKNYFEVNRKTFTVRTTDYTRVEMSKKCAIEVKDYGDRVSVKMFGDGRFVNKTVKPLPPGELLAIAGDDKDQSAWFIIIRQIDSK